MFAPSRIAPISISVVVGVAVAGCGGGGKQEVSPADLVQKADQICREERSSFDRIQAHPPPNASVAADQTGELIRATENANAELGDLQPPDELEASYDRYLEARGRVVDEMRRGREAAEDRLATAYGAAQAAVARDAPKRRELAESLGFKACSSSPASA